MILHTGEIINKANARRQLAIDTAIKQGVRTQNVASRLARDERETVVVKNLDGTMTIDTTIQKDIRLLIDKNYPIEELTFCGGKLIGAKFLGESKQLTFRNTRNSAVFMQ